METLGCYKIIHPSPIRCFSGGYVSFRAAKPCTIVSTKTSAVCKPEAPGRIQTGAEYKMSGSKTMLSTGFAKKLKKKHNLNRITKRVANIFQVIFLQVRLSTAMATLRRAALSVSQHCRMTPRKVLAFRLKLRHVDLP